MKTLLSKAIKGFLTNIKGWQLEKLALVIVGYEGNRADVQHQREVTSAVFRRFSGFCVGPSAGAGWQEKKYDLPYVRDFALAHAHWAEPDQVVYSEAIPAGVQ